jgi:hypothetical protein
MKRIVVKIAGSEREPFDITIKPKTTAGEILARLNLEDYVLSLIPNPDQFLDFFEDEQDLYPKLTEVDRLVAIPSSKAPDAYLNQIVFGTPFPTEEAQRKLRKLIEEEVSR